MQKTLMLVMLVLEGWIRVFIALISNLSYVLLFVVNSHSLLFKSDNNCFGKTI